MDGAPVQAEPGPAGLRVGEVVGERGLGAGLDPTSQLSTRGRWRLPSPLRSACGSPTTGTGPGQPLTAAAWEARPLLTGLVGAGREGNAPSSQELGGKSPGTECGSGSPPQPLTSLVSLGAFLIPSEALVFSPVTEHPPDRGEVPQTGT